MTELKTSLADWKDNRYPCVCSEAHHIRLLIDDDHPVWGYLEIADAYQANTFRGKMKAVFKILRGKPHYHSGIVLDDDNAKDLYDTIGYYLSKKKGKQ